MKCMSIPPLGIHSQKIAEGVTWLNGDNCSENREQCMENLVNDIICFLFQTYAFHTDNHNMPEPEILDSHMK